MLEKGQPTQNLVVMDETPPPPVPLKDWAIHNRIYWGITSSSTWVGSAQDEVPV